MKRNTLSFVLSAAALFVSLAVLAGYALGYLWLTTWDSATTAVRMALPTATAIALLSVSTILNASERMR